MVPRHPPTTCAAMYSAASRVVDRAEGSVGEGDDRVEVGTGHGTEHEDQSDQRGGGCGCVLEELQADVVG